MLAKLVQSGGLNAIARQLGAPPAATLTEARLLMPGLLHELSQFPGGFSALLALFEEYHGDRFAAAIMSPEPVDAGAGEAIIARIGGIPLAHQADESGDAGLRLRMAPLLVMLAVGYLSARAAAGLTEAELALLLAPQDYRGSTEEEAV